ncbi:putative transcriptional regulator YdeE [Algoriphagus sp. 4150]|uniref:GyrI-like domain-containing protein n=1 Tax=Algoriphagus sp. 4150 TaxID=2817756 RepID=UPI00285CD237|nr:effector binding domain-containing protein [Algoriphagus sp. 4150]MDR7130940.1 putative transcriptional regulator YdeE [Algoriphagus sp. 4150]
MQKVKIEPFKLIGIAIRTTNEGQKADREIAGLWQRFMGEGILEKIPNKVDYTIYSLYTDYEGDHTKPYTAMLGCKVGSLDEIPEGMVGKSFDGGTYIKTSAKGDLMKGLIVTHWTKIWEMDLSRLYTADFEAYGEKAQDPSDAEVDFFVAVEE